MGVYGLRLWGLDEGRLRYGLRLGLYFYLLDSAALLGVLLWLLYLLDSLVCLLHGLGDYVPGFLPGDLIEEPQDGTLSLLDDELGPDIYDLEPHLLGRIEGLVDLVHLVEDGRLAPFKLVFLDDRASR